MLHINGAIVVEGKYDKIHLSPLVDCPIITTEGFGIFKNDETKELIRFYAKNGGIIILTDSDFAGFKIRGYIKGIVAEGDVKNVYIPDIFGKEKRKTAPSKEGKLGVEGIDVATLEQAFVTAGVISEREDEPRRKITRLDLYDDGYFGKPDSKAKRILLLDSLNLPTRLSTSGLLDVLNFAVTFEEYKQITEKIWEP